MKLLLIITGSAIMAASFNIGRLATNSSGRPEQDEAHEQRLKLYELEVHFWMLYEEVRPHLLQKHPEAGYARTTEA